LFFFQAEDGIREVLGSRGLGEVDKRQAVDSLNRLVISINDPSVAGLVDVSKLTSRIHHSGLGPRASGLGSDPLGGITLEDFHQTFRLNVDTAFVMTKTAVSVFRKAGYGKVVNVASLAAFGNHWDMGNAAYDAAKAAVIGLTRTLSRSLGRDGIRLNVVAPGMVFTERVAASFGEEFVARQRARTPLDRLTSPGDVAELIAFLLDSKSDQITGEVIRVSGGLY